MPGPAVTAKIEAWRDSVLAWFVANPGGTTRQQNVEAALTAGELDRLLGDMWDYREAYDVRFPQTLANLGQPTDRPAPFDHGFTLPWWGDCIIDEWEGPDGKGCWINFLAREGTETVPTDLYQMSLTWFPGPSGENFRSETMGWNLVDESDPFGEEGLMASSSASPTMWDSTKRYASLAWKATVNGVNRMMGRA